MTDIQKQVALKKLELTGAHNEQERLWDELKVAEKSYRTRYEAPWHEAMEKERALKLELSILEGVAKQMEATKAA